MRWSWLFVVCVCVACERPPEPEATSEPPTPTREELAEPGGPTKPMPPTPMKDDAPEAVEVAKAQTSQWVYPSSEMFSEGAVVSLLGVERLGEVRGWMKKDPRLRVRIEVHTDPRGSSAFNMKKSKERAKSLLGVLSEEDAAFAARVEAVGRGEEVAPREGATASRVVIALVEAPPEGD